MPIPYVIPPLGYEPGSRHNLSDTVPAFIAPGQTTRADVLLTLGQPDSSAPDGPFVYTSAYRKGGVGSALLIYGAGDLPFGNAERTAYRRLTLTFDEQGRVSAATMDLKTCWRKSGNSVIGSAFGDPGSVSSSCITAAPRATSDAAQAANPAPVGGGSGDERDNDPGYPVWGCLDHFLQREAASAGAAEASGTADPGQASSTDARATPEQRAADIVTTDGVQWIDDISALTDFESKRSPFNRTRIGSMSVGNTFLAFNASGDAQSSVRIAFPEVATVSVADGVTSMILLATTDGCHAAFQVLDREPGTVTARTDSLGHLIAERLASFRAQSTALTH